MKIEYVRNVQSGYMRIIMSESLNKIEEEMLMRNTIEGILPVCWQKEDDKYLLRYDITGKQALDVLLENTLVDENIMRSLLVGVCVAVKQLEKYLLLSEGLLLLPETIFFDAKSETMSFCYCPEVDEPLQLRLTRLMEYILAKTDHKNLIAVQLVYGIYEEMQNVTFSIRGLQEYLWTSTVAEKERKSEKHREEMVVNESVADIYEISLQKKNILEEIMSWIKEKIKIVSRKKGEDKKMLFESEEAADEWMKTKMLNTLEEEIQGILKYEGTNLLPDITISVVPFTIGTAKDCDGVIKCSAISRYHAKITLTEGIYFIEDLNSTNGTKVDGGLLSYRTRVSLKKNEKIHFANEPYRFL